MAITVCLDAGHGGYDSGCVSPDEQYLEKTITLQIALILQDKLESAGFNVVMTRTEDVSPSGDSNKDHELYARTKIANDSNADVFLSIHVNAGGGRGAEVCIYNDGGSIRDLAEKIVDNVSEIVGGYHGEKFKTRNDLYVLSHTKMPACLIEIGFIDSDDLDKFINRLSDEADAILRAFCDFYNVDLPSEPKTPQEGNTMPNLQDWQENAIQWAKDNGVSDGSRPLDNITRVEVMAMLKNYHENKGK